MSTVFKRAQFTRGIKEIRFLQSPNLYTTNPGDNKGISQLEHVGTQAGVSKGCNINLGGQTNARVIHKICSFTGGAKITNRKRVSFLVGSNQKQILCFNLLMISVPLLQRKAEKTQKRRHRLYVQPLPTIQFP